MEIDPMALPTGPTPVADAPANQAPTLRWDRVAAGCTPRTPPSPTPAQADANIEKLGESRIAASWPTTMPDGTATILHAQFVLNGNDYELCTWDYADV